MKVFVRTFGCQMNFHDSSRVLELMEGRGWTAVDSAAAADVILVNSCSIREKAWHKAVSEVGRMCAMKRHRPEIIIALLGCVAEQEKESLFERAPGLDLVVGPDHYADLPELLEQTRSGQRSRALVGFFEPAGVPSFLSIGAKVRSRSPVAFVSIMKGCSERCAYCIVPGVRGPERCRPAQEIVEETRALVSQGAKEVVLLGQKVNAYGCGDMTFAGLLVALDAIPGLERLRFTSPHPRHMTDDLIGCFGRLRVLCESIHLPAQAGSDRVLERMGRRYTARFYRDVARRLREASSGLAISTDFIVGFPGETAEDFEETLRLCEDVRFSSAFSFKYSPRPGTEAARFVDDVTAEVKARRLEALHDVIGRIEQEIKAELVGRRLEILVEGAARRAGQLSGRARNNQIVNCALPDGATLEAVEGCLAEVGIIAALPHCLEGRVSVA